MFFVSQCTLLSNTSTLPHFTIRTDKRLSSLKVNEYNILSIIKSLNSKISHGWDKLSIKIIKMCDKALVCPLKLIFKASIQQGVFQDCWKKSTVVTIHKESKKLLKNYRPFSLLPLFGKVYERSIFKELLIVSIKINFLQNVCLVFYLGDSCTLQLLSIVHEINSSIDCDRTIDVIGVFLDISKARPGMIEFCLN